MRYQCLDCTYIGKQFPAGRCPGCGSLNVESLDAGGREKTVARKPYRLALAVALWLYLAFEIYKKLA